MKKNYFLIIFSVLVSLSSFSQQLPIGECGIVSTYDANGNRLRRVYFCNLNGQDYPQGRPSVDSASKNDQLTNEVEFVDALFPNPTTGKFFITFSKELRDAKVYLMDVNGKIVQSFVGNGLRLSFNLANVANGIYFVRVEADGLVITKKVIKN